MDQDTVINLAQQAMTLAMKVGGPLLLVGLAIGLIVSVFQAVTQIQEQSLSFIPKIVGVGVVIVVAGPWMLNQLLSYTEKLYRTSRRWSVADERTLLRHSSAACRRRRLLPRARAHQRRCSLVAPLFSSQQVPGARAHGRRRRVHDRPDAARDARSAPAERRDAARRADPQGAARRARLRALDRAPVRGDRVGRRDPRLADRLLLRRSRRPAHRQPVGRAHAASTGSSRSPSSS